MNNVRYTTADIGRVQLTFISRIYVIPWYKVWQFLTLNKTKYQKGYRIIETQSLEYYA